MTAVRRVLFATDFSPASAPAWAFAQRLATATGAEVVLLHALPMIPLPMEGAFDARTYERLLEAGRGEAQADLDRMVSAAPGLRVTSRLVDGPPAQSVLATAERETADIVVVGTHGRTGLNRLLVGSVAEHVIQLAPRPVVTVRPLSLTGGRPDWPIRTIVYPTDFSAAARKGWHWAKMLAEATGAGIELVHALMDVVPDRHMDPVTLDRMARAMRAEAEQGVERFVAEAEFPRERIHVHLAHGVEADAIVHRAESVKADLIVMGTHGRTGVLRLALGSVARRVLHTAPCAVLTVGPHAPDRPPA